MINTAYLKEHRIIWSGDEVYKNLLQLVEHSRTGVKHWLKAILIIQMCHKCLSSIFDPESISLLNSIS